MRVAVVGAGPSGVFATAELLTRPGVEVDVLDRSHTPFGLVRYGVAPDHLKIKTVSTALSRVLADERVRFHGGVELGRDISLDELRRLSDAVVLATGARDSRRLGIPGEDRPRSFTAADLVPWYNGHPLDGVRWSTASPSVAVVGAGNVALDVSRILLKGGAGLANTDLPDSVAAVLDARPVTDVHLVIRRGVGDVRFSPAELLEFDHLDVDVLVDPAELDLGPADRARATDDRLVAQRIAMFTRWAEAGPVGAGRRLHVHFHRSPTEIRGGDGVEAIRLRDNRSGRIEELSVGAVVTAIGYHAAAPAGLPTTGGLVHHDAGRVAPGLYVAGWLKRGPSGVIGTNKACAVESVRALWADVDSAAITVGAGGPADLVRSRLPEAVDWTGWTRIDAAEIALGATTGRARTKITNHAELARLGAAAVLAEEAR